MPWVLGWCNLTSTLHLQDIYIAYISVSVPPSKPEIVFKGRPDPADILLRSAAASGPPAQFRAPDPDRPDRTKGAQCVPGSQRPTRSLAHAHTQEKGNNSHPVTASACPAKRLLTTRILLVRVPPEGYSGVQAYRVDSVVVRAAIPGPALSIYYYQSPWQRRLLVDRPPRDTLGDCKRAALKLLSGLQPCEERSAGLLEQEAIL